jgi:hypothetical protein
MKAEISFTVEGFPPAKNEALSMLGERHSHRPRVLLLLQAAQQALERSGCPLFQDPIGLST